MSHRLYNYYVVYFVEPSRKTLCVSVEQVQLQSSKLAGGLRFAEGLFVSFRFSEMSTSFLCCFFCFLPYILLNLTSW